MDSLNDLINFVPEYSLTAVNDNNVEDFIIDLRDSNPMKITCKRQGVVHRVFLGKCKYRPNNILECLFNSDFKQKRKEFDPELIKKANIDSSSIIITYESYIRFGDVTPYEFRLIISDFDDYTKNRKMFNFDKYKKQLKVEKDGTIVYND